MINFKRPTRFKMNTKIFHEKNSVQIIIVDFIIKNNMFFGPSKGNNLTFNTI